MNNFESIINIITQFYHGVEDKKWLENLVQRLFVAIDDGHSCLLLGDGELEILQKKYSDIITLCDGDNNIEAKLFTIYQVPNKNFLYITRYFYYEKLIAVKLLQFLEHETYSPNSEISQTLSEIKDSHNFPNEEQFQSILNSLSRKFNIITGGPGTGKTTTVALLLWAMCQQYGQDLKIKICAPTGKASKRVLESINSNIDWIEEKFGFDMTMIRHLIINSCSTIHSMLGYIHQSIYFKNNSDNYLEIDVLIIDESSMIGLPLFYKLLYAVDINKIKHIICLGDPNQLSSVEEGAVFSSLVKNSLISKRYISKLVVSNRNKGDVGIFANYLLSNNIDMLGALVDSSSDVLLHSPELKTIYDNIFKQDPYLIKFLEYCRNINHRDLDNVTNIKNLFAEYNHCTLLCMNNIGRLGVDNLNVQIENYLKQFFIIHGNWYSGKVIIILKNDRNLELYNGDIGICIVDSNKKIRIFFDDGRSFIPQELPKYQLAFAITIHKSQGSEYEKVKIVIPNNPHISRELIYTAITRAKNRVDLFCEKDNLLNTILTNRMSGLSSLIINRIKNEIS